MNVIDAAHATVHDYPGGSVALAARLGMAGAVLRGKVNVNDVGHHLTLTEAQRIQSLTGDHRMLLAMADELGYLCLPLPAVSDGDLVHATLRAIQSFGMMMGDVERSIEDGRVTPNELRKVERAMLDAVAHVSGLHRLLAHQAGGR